MQTLPSWVICKEDGGRFLQAKTFQSLGCRVQGMLKSTNHMKRLDRSQIEILSPFSFCISYHVFWQCTFFIFKVAAFRPRSNCIYQLTSVTFDLQSWVASCKKFRETTTKDKNTFLITSSSYQQWQLFLPTKSHWQKQYLDYGFLAPQVVVTV